MILTIKFISDEAEGFSRTLRIDADNTFLDLNKAILDACGYADDQLTSFYICDDDWQRHAQITRQDMGSGNPDEDLYTMEATSLAEFLEDEGQKLEYVFDPFSERTFFLQVKRCEPSGRLTSPEVTAASGSAPQQIADLDFSLPAADTTSAADDEIFGGEGIDIEDIDLEGFEFSDDSAF